MLKKLSVLIVTCGILMAAAPRAFAVTFTPSPSDLYDLDHFYYTSWGMNWHIPIGQQIVSAQLTIKNIYNWAHEDNDILYINLLDSASLGVHEYYDNQASGNGFSTWSGNHILLTTYTDVTDLVPENYVFNFSALDIQTLTQYIQNDGRFGLGFDPDCHYFNDGVKFKIITERIPHVVPEPASVVLLVSGLFGGLVCKRKRRA